MLQLALKAVREALDRPAAVADQLAAHHNVPQKLSVVGVVVLRKGRDFLQLADIVKCGCRDQQVMVEVRILRTEKFAHGDNRQGVLKEPADKAVVDRLGGRVLHEGSLEVLIPEIFGDELLQPGVLHALERSHELLVHLFRILLADREIIRSLVFIRRCGAGALDVQLQAVVEAGHFPGDIDIVERFEILDAGSSGIPDLAVDGSGLILERDVLVAFSVPRSRTLPVLAEIDIADMVAFLK